MQDFKLDPQLKSDTIELGSLSLCKVLLMNNAQLPWVILVPQRPNITELYQLKQSDISQAQNESLMISKLMMDHFNGDKLNTGALGNIVSQLHLHHIIRFKTDPVWPKPVWGNIEAKPYSQEQLTEISSSLKNLIQKTSTPFTPNNQ